MRLLLVTIGTDVIPSSRTRAYQWLPHLRQHGVTVRLLPLSLSLRYRLRIDTLTKSNYWVVRISFWPSLAACLAVDLIVLPVRLTQILFFASVCDTVYLQKTTLSNRFMRLLKRINPNLVYDFDDALQEDSVKKRRGLIAALRVCRLVTVENDFNAHFVKKKFGLDAVRILGPIDCDRYHPHPYARAHRSRVVIGWIGSHSTVPHLLERRDSLLRILQQHPNCELHLIGAPGRPIDHPRCFTKPWSLATEVSDMSAFDIGIMPLPDTPFTQGKGGYKILQYMALGIPSLASPVGVNTNIIEHHKTGLLVSSPDEWFSALNLLVQNREVRGEWGVEARKQVVSRYSFQSYVQLLIAGLNGCTHPTTVI